MHQVFLNLAFVDGSVVHYMATYAFNIIVVVKLSQEICEFFTLSKLFVNLDVWINAEVLDRAKVERA